MGIRHAPGRTGRRAGRAARYAAAVALAATALPVTVASAATAPTSSGARATAINWPSYLDGPLHNSYAAQATAITPANAAKLTEAWHFMPGKPPVKALGYDLNASPTVYDGTLYIGGNNGTFYALSETTGKVLWQRAIGYIHPKAGSCGTRGITSTATVADAPGTSTPTVYVTSGNGYMYAMNAATGAVDWKVVTHLPVGDDVNYYNWSSPVVVSQKIYVGISGSCVDHVRGAVMEYAQSTGKVLGQFYTVPKGQVGGSVWSTVAVAPNGHVFVGTGNVLPPTKRNLGSSEAVVELKGDGLGELGHWQLPVAQQPDTDSDFGASVSLFPATLPGSTTSTPMLGVCNKNGVYYAFKRADLAAGPVWSTRVAAVNPGSNGMTAACLSSTAVKGNALYVAGTATTIGGTTYQGSVTELNAATGKVVWATGLPAPVFGSVSLDGGGVLAVSTQGSSTEPEADYLVNPATGAILATVSNGDSTQFAQPVFADNYLFIATQTKGLYAYQAPTS